MTKEEFDAKYVGENIRVCCRTRRLNNEFVSLARSFGYKLTSSYIGEKIDVCCDVRNDSYYHIDWYRRQDINIIYFKSLKNKNTKKQEIKEFVVSEDEKSILKVVFEKYKYIARNKSGILCIYNTKPEKFGNRWVNCDLSLVFRGYQDLFNMVVWRDDEATKIEDLLNS